MHALKYYFASFHSPIVSFFMIPVLALPPLLRPSSPLTFEARRSHASNAASAKVAALVSVIPKPLFYLEKH